MRDTQQVRNDAPHRLPFLHIIGFVAATVMKLPPAATQAAPVFFQEKALITR